MSPTLTDANATLRDPGDGLAVLEKQGSIAETYGIPLVLYLWSPRRDFVCKTADVVAQVLVIVNSINNFTETAWLASLLAPFEWADIQTVT